MNRVVSVVGMTCAMAWVLPAWLISFIVLAVLVYYRRWLYVAVKTAPRDLRAFFHYIRMLYLARQMEKDNSAVADMFHSNVLKCPDKICFLMNDEVWTFKQVEEFSLRVSAVLRYKGLKKDGVVSLMMSNCPEYPATWLGITRLGAVAALLNTNQKGETLIHSINIVKCDMIIYGDEYENVLHEIKKDLSQSIIFLKFTHRRLNTSSNVESSESTDDFTSMLERTPASPWFRAEGDGIRGKLLYIYTSGTTGLPKAAVLSSQKVLNMAAGIRYIGGVKPDQDVVYCPMPLYHSAGGCIAIGLALVFGCTVALRKKFSASAYFKDCITYNATVAQYIGEMCRYILATPPSPTDTQHKVRNIFGNGLRPTIWPDFVKRFNIKHVAEFYGATESNASILNPDNTTGAIGFLSRILPHVYPINLIKVNQETGEPIRDARGICQLAEPIEPGVFVSKIDQNKPFGAYLGYIDKEASEKKIIRDVFEFGDVAFLSGDIMVADELGYLYFRDRTGDTFRWRGENVSTTEVEAAISRVADHRDVVVYGVEIPNTEGRAGMCGIMDPYDSLDLNQLLKDISMDLPKYARPIFIRKLRSLDKTGTFKIRKMDLQKEGYDPNKVSDKIYYLDKKLDKYLPLGPEDYDRIISGQGRL